MLVLGDSPKTQRPRQVLPERETKRTSTPFHHSSREAGFPTARRIPRTNGKVVCVSSGAAAEEETSENNQQEKADARFVELPGFHDSG
jgi:hypothetical protein